MSIKNLTAPEEALRPNANEPRRIQAAAGFCFAFTKRWFLKAVIYKQASTWPSCARSYRGKWIVWKHRSALAYGAALML